MGNGHAENFFTDGRTTLHPQSRTQLELQAEGQADNELTRHRAEFASMQRRHRQEMDDLSALNISMFGRTSPEVAVNALALATEDAHHQAKLRVAEGRKEEDILDIRQYRAKIQGKEVIFYAQGEEKKPSFMDDGKNIFVPGYQNDVALLASLQLAQMRWGTIKVTGNDEFITRVVQMAADYDFQLANEDLALRVHQRRNSGGTLSAPSKEDVEAAASFKTDHEEIVPEPVEPRPACTAAPVLNTVFRNEAEYYPVQHTPLEPTSVDARELGEQERKDVTKGWKEGWTKDLQEERRVRAEMRAGRSGSTQAGKEMSEEAIEIDVPDEEPDLGYDDNDNFSLDVPSASTVLPDKKKSVSHCTSPSVRP